MDECISMTIASHENDLNFQNLGLFFTPCLPADVFLHRWIDDLIQIFTYVITLYFIRRINISIFKQTKTRSDDKEHYYH